MASPTAIPHPETSAHHHCHHIDQQDSVTNSSSNANPYSRSPTGTSPNPLVSPIYTSAGRSAFSLPGPNSKATSPTTTTWYSAGFASNNSQRVRSPSTTFTTSSAPGQRDYFAETNKSPTSAHLRHASFGSASRSSSISSADLMEPTTPKPFEGGMPLGRVPSLPKGATFDQVKAHRGSWSSNTHTGWNGLSSFRGAVPLSADNNATPTAAPSTSGGMGGIFRKFSFGSTGGPPRMDMNAASPPPKTIAEPANNMVPATATTMPDSPDAARRGRQVSVNGNGSIPKRRPSPMGERLLMGHFSAH